MATKKGWMKIPPKPPKPKMPDYLKSVVKNKAEDFVESFLKSTFIKDPPKDQSCCVSMGQQDFTHQHFLAV